MSFDAYRKPLTKHRIIVLGKTLRELANDAGISIMALSQVENGYLHLFARKRQKFATIYGLTLEAYEEMVKGARDGKGEQP